ncbi:TPA: magnesium-translocating P-type ATPase [Bacillus tropicus]|uniref:Magnesium-transporting ATPase, P-type 1 n=2 Tax=Bacillus cereus group TaxID=86661 RepID=A0A7T2QJW9_9BACI|nr:MULTISPECIES: magnesium-translocating P-type ATPase [Bacillus]AIY77085.1 magnesium-translocating P-type ATPase [Bacillus cereus]AJI03835.1 magnesium-translocating P-type ATPase [Bacillus cereus G9241]AJG92913.1 magnesium-translocating P-type ATPase [Bacillus cereus]EAL13542.1 magnesium-translocating P-type ATPase [Bacillus cereus G9241]KDB43154.1 magnesium ABC transporter ATPase [Bacillus cereus]
MLNIQRQETKHAYNQESIQTNNELLVEVATQDVNNALRLLETTEDGLSKLEASRRLSLYGLNEIAHNKTSPWYIQFLLAFKNPFIFVLLALGALSFFTDDIQGTIVVSVMVMLSATIRFLQEFRSQKAANQLKAMVRTTASVFRIDGFVHETKNAKKLKQTDTTEIPIEELVPGDIISLSAGDIVPADVRILSAKDLFVNQSSLTGESLPVEKYEHCYHTENKHLLPKSTKKNYNPLDMENLCFMGTNIVSGSAKAVVISTSTDTYFGSLANKVIGKRVETSFDKGVNKVSWLLITFMLIMAPIVLLINGFTKGDWQEAFFFAIAIAVGLTPEMLPMIVTANLAKGAVNMSKQKVIVKQLNSIQNLGAMNILCTDKTGTLTEDKVVLVRHLDPNGNTCNRVLHFAYLNSFYQTGLKNLIDKAVMKHTEENQKFDPSVFQKLDEIPFDFARRRMSVIVKNNSGEHTMICKGAVEEVLSICNYTEVDGKVVSLTDDTRLHVKQLSKTLNSEGMRVIAVAYKKDRSTNNKEYTVQDENDMILAGYIGFLDPPKPSAATAIQALQKHGVRVKILTGDNEIVTKKVCKEVGLNIGEPVLGYEIDALPDKALAKLAEETTVFAKLNPMQKSRIIRVLQGNGHTVGYMGDGINDAIALRKADVGICVDTATDIAKESSDIILLEKSLMILEAGILEGRTTFGNILKYIKMTASSNFGNVFSVLVASAFIPFLPMLAIHLLIQNLLYDISQLSIPWDKMDKEFLEKPRKWDTANLRNFIICIGPISSIFDLITYVVMWNVFGANTASEQSLFQSGWFVVGLLTQTLIVHMIRTQKIPFVQSTASVPVLLLTACIMAIGIYIPFSPLGAAVGLQALPLSYFPWLVGILLGYAFLTQLLKKVYIKKFHSWL